MSDEPQDPKLMETPGEPTPEAQNLSSSGQRPPEEQLPENQPHSDAPAQAEAQAGAAANAPKNRGEKPRGREAGNFFQRLTGSLRRLTGPLSDPGSPNITGTLHESEHSPSDESPLPQVDKENPERPTLQSSPLRRDTGPLSDSGLTGFTGSLEETPQQPAPETDWMSEVRASAGEEDGGADASPVEPAAADEVARHSLEDPYSPQRMTGPLGDSGRLGDTGAFNEPPLPLDSPSSEVDWMSDLRDEPSETQPASTDWMAGLPSEPELPGEEKGPEATASLRRMTGPLRESSGLPDDEILYEPGQPADSAEQEVPAEPVLPTEPLSQADWMSEIREEAEPVVEPDPMPEISQPEAGLPEPEPVELPDVTFTAPPVEPMSPLRRVTGSLRKIITGALHRQPEGDQAEISDDVMAGRLEHTLTSTQKHEFRLPKPERETDETEKPTTGSLVRRVTGSLRRVTGSLRGTGPLGEPPAPPQARPVPWQQPEQPTKQPPAASTDWMSELRSEPDELVERVEPDTPPIETAEIAAPADWMSDIREKTGPSFEPEPEPQIGQPQAGLTEPEPVEPPGAAFISLPPVEPMSPFRRVTGSLRKILTGALRRQPSADQPEISDDLMAGRLEHTLTSAQKGDTRLGKREKDEEEGQRTTTGSLIRRVTGSLRRVTGSLRGTGPLGEPPAPPQERPVPWQQPPVVETPPAVPPAETAPDLGLEAEDLLSMEEQTGLHKDPLLAGLEDETPLSGDEPISLLESGAIAALGEAEKPAVEPDWMTSIREETTKEGRKAGGEGSDEDQTGLHRMTGSLRRLFTDIVGGPEKDQVQDLEPEFSEPLFSEQLGADVESLQESAAEIDLEQPVEAQFTEEEIFDDGLGFLDSLEARFGQFEDLELPEEQIGELTGAQEEINPYDFLSPEEINIWDETGQAAAPDMPGTATDNIWADISEPELPPDLSKRLWSDAAEENKIPEEPAPPQAPRLSQTDALQAEFLTGEEAEIPEEEETYGNYLRGVLEKLEGEEQEPAMSVQDLRAIALEDYEEDEQEWRAPEKAAAAPSDEPGALAPAAAAAVEESYLSEPAWNLKTWISTHSRSEKILLLEAAVVALVLLIAVPFFIFMIARGSAQPQEGTFTTRPLPAGLPYPVSLVLPGGWDFSLQKSTISSGQWKPSASEWLEGTELRRVVALPWNAQTEAVVRSFQPGDMVRLSLSNNRSVDYEVETVERVPVNDASILSDLKPSLVIILYEERSDSRWVVICKP